MFVQGYRASKILYNFLISNNIKGKFILPANVCGIIPLTFHYAGIDFDFFDIQNDNLCIDQNMVLNNTNNYSGVLFVRTYGIEENFDFFFKNIKKKNPKFIIIDDCCLCMPCLNIKSIENIDLKLYSLGYAKQVDLKLGAFGFLSSNFQYKDIQLDKFDSLHYEMYEHELKKAINTNNTLEITNFYFLENKEYTINRQLIEESIELSKKHKDKINYIYRNELPKSIQLDEKFQNWRFNILVDPDNKTKIISELFENKLFASTHYYPLAYLWRNQKTPISLSLYNKVINLFNDLYYTEEQAIYSCKIIRKYM